MMRRGLFPALLAAALAALGAFVSAQVRTQTPFRVGIEVVSLNVTVTDPTNRYVTNLTRDDFQVFEDGVRQEVTFFSAGRLPVAIALLLDTSSSMEDKIAIAQEAAVGLTKQLGGQDSAEVIQFDSRVQILQKFSNDPAELERAIRSTSAGGSTSLYNAVYISLKELKKIQVRSTEEIRRQAIIVLSDGEDTQSLISFEELLDLAKRSETSIYAIGLRSREITMSRGFKEGEYHLRQLAQETGGRAFFPNQVADLPVVYKEVFEELATQYTLGYSSKNPRRDGMWRRVVVRVNRPNASARTKQGYYAPTMQ